MATLTIPTPILSGASSLLTPYAPWATPEALLQYLQSPPSSRPLTGPADRLLRVAEVAERLAVAERTVWRFSQHGQLPPVRIGAAVRFRESSVKALIDRGS